MDVRPFEEQLVSELRVFRDLYGYRFKDQAQWALGCMSPEQAQYFLAGWRQGRRGAWQYLKRLADRVRTVSGDSDEAWIARLHDLELVAGVDTHIIEPTTQGALLSRERAITPRRQDCD